MNFRSYILSTLSCLTMSCGLMACQYDADWPERCDSIYNQMDRKEIKSVKRLQYKAGLAKKEESELIKAAQDSVAQKIQRSVTKLIAMELKRQGIDPQSVDVEVNLSCSKKK